MIRQNLALITTLVSFALVALIGVQVFWIKNAVQLKEDDFNRKVHEALDNLVYDLEKMTAAAKIKKKVRFRKQVATQKTLSNLIAGDSTHGKDKITVKIMEELSIDSNGVVTTSIKERQYEGDSTTNIDGYPAPLKKTGPDLQALKMELIENRAEMFNDIFDELVSINIYKDYKPNIDSLLLDSLLRAEIASKGIKASYVYEVNELPEAGMKELENGSVVDTTLKVFKVNLSPNNIFIKPLYLKLHFPHERNYLMKTLWRILCVSGLIILGLILAFYYTIHTIHKQKRYSQIKNDFISNMTHELKTPISTISLAGEMLSDEAVKKTPEKADRFVKMIREENKRLGVLVESVLQTAVLDKGDFKLKLSEFDLHEVINSAMDKVRLQVEQKGGKLETQLAAANPMLFADKVHITNIVYNLLDNAIKYSKDTPEISLSTQNNSAGILMQVKDNGIGIGKENQKKVFEQFYRVSTGNVHNVRGFGLGLSYVRAIVQKHGGEVSVESELGRGSTFEVFLPFKTEIIT